jgi:aminotransferase
MREDYSNRRTILLAGLNQAGLTYEVPEGAYYVMADFKHINWNQKKYAKAVWNLDRVFSEYLAREIGVAVVPASSFYTDSAEGHTRVRFNFAKRPDTLEKAAKLLLKLRDLKA